jgi:hypothetical protein
MEDKDFYKEIYEKVGKVMKSKGNNHPEAIQLMSRLNNLYAKNGNAKPSNTGGSVFIPPSIQIELNTIREHLEFRGDISIHYDFIKEDHWRKQLLADNIRMENTKLRMKGDDGRLFDSANQFKMYCRYACYQIEFLLNYYFNKRFSFSISNLTRYHEQQIKSKRITTWDVKGNTINQVPLEFKLKFFLDWDQIGVNKNTILLDYLISIKNIRNLDSHRAVERKEESPPPSNQPQKIEEILYDERDFKTVFIYLDKFVKFAETQLKALKP